MPEMSKTPSRKGPFAQQLRRFLAEEGYRPRLEVGDGCPSTLNGVGVELPSPSDDQPSWQLFLVEERVAGDTRPCGTATRPLVE